MEWLKKNEQYQFFEPNGPQEKLIKMVGTSDDMVSIFSAANGVGKTACVINILAALIWGSPSKYFQMGKFKNWPYPKRIRYITDPKLVEEIGPFQSEIERWWPKGQYESYKNGKQYNSVYRCHGPAGMWIIDVMTYEQDVRQFEGGTLGGVIFDEPPPRDIWGACVRGLRSGGILIGVMTPMIHAGWFFDEVAPRHQDKIIYASMEENCKTHGIRGQLEHSHIQNLIRELPFDEVEARAHGKALYLAGLIYKQFDPRVHVLKEPVQVPSGAPVYQAVDPHSDKPFAVIWGFPESNGDFYIVDEWPNEDFTKMHNCQLNLGDYKNIFKDKESGVRIEKRIIDRRFADVHHHSGLMKKTLRDELSEMGLDFYPNKAAEEEVETGIIKVREYLEYASERPISNINRPKLYLNPHCQNTIRSFQRWSRDQKTGKVKEDYKDFMDCVRMILMENPTVDVSIPADAGQPRRMWGGGFQVRPDTI